MYKARLLEEEPLVLDKYIAVLNHRPSRSACKSVIDIDAPSSRAKITYQVIDSFDWEDRDGLRKRFAFPSKARMADIRGVEERTVQRHIQELEAAGLISRESRGETNIYWIEDISEQEARRYEEKFLGGDENVSPWGDKNVSQSDTKRTNTK